MEIQARQLLVAVFGIAIAIGFAANAVHGETATPVVVGLAKCSDCARRNMNVEAAFKGLQVAVKCKNSKGEYESTAVGRVDKSGAFSVPLAADAVGDDGELKSECFAQLHSASSAPCPGQEPSKIVAAPPGGTDKTFVAVGGKVYHRSSPECASAFLCHHFFHSIVHHHHVGVGVHTPVVVPHVPDHGHGHSVPSVTKPPAVDVPVHKPAPVPVPEHKPPSVPVDTPPSSSTPTAPSTPVYSPPKPTPIYHPPTQRDAVTGP